MSRWKRVYENQWLSPVRETLSHIVIFLPLIIAILVSLTLPLFTQCRAR